MEDQSRVWEVTFVNAKGEKEVVTGVVADNFMKAADAARDVAIEKYGLQGRQIVKIFGFLNNVIEI